MKTSEDVLAGDPRDADTHGKHIDADASPSTIEKQIDAKRADINRTLNALEERFSPGQMVDQTLGVFRDNGGEMAQNLGRQMRDNPVPFLLAGVGLAWAMMSSSRSGRSDSSVGHYRSRYGYGGDYDGRRFDERDDFGGDDRDDRYGRERYHGPVGDGGSDLTPRYTAGTVPSTTGSYADVHAYDGDDDDDGFLDKARDGFDVLGNRLSDAKEDLTRKVSEMSDEARRRYESMSDEARTRYDEGRRRYAEMDAEGRRRYHDTRIRARLKRQEWERGLRDGMASARDYGRDAGRRARRQARSTVSSASDFVQEQPMVAGALGVAVGALIGALLPASRVEDRYVGEYADEAKRAARQQGEAGLERVREEAESGVEQLRDTVENTAGTVREKAERTAEEARSLAEDRIDEADRKASVGDDKTKARETDVSSV